LTLFELIAALITLTSIYLATRENVWYYPTGIVSVVMYAWVYFQAKLYAEAVLQGIWLVLLASKKLVFGGLVALGALVKKFLGGNKDAAAQAS
jgi:nicotinamide riboside transporter PnuC